MKNKYFLHPPLYSTHSVFFANTDNTLIFCSNSFIILFDVIAIKAFLIVSTFAERLTMWVKLCSNFISMVLNRRCNLRLNFNPLILLFILIVQLTQCELLRIHDNSLGNSTAFKMLKDNLLNYKVLVLLLQIL